MNIKEDIQTFPGLPTDGVLQLQLAGISYKDPTYHIRRQFLDITVFEYVMEGRGTLIIEGEKFRITPGCCYIVPSWISHEYFSDSRDPWVKCWVNLSGPLVQSLREVYGLQHTYVFPEAVEAGALLHKIVQELRMMPEEEMLPYMEREILHLIQALAHTITQKKKEDPPSPATVAILKFLRNHITGPMPELSEIAEVINRSPAQTIRIFRHDMGVTPCRWLLQEKIRMACSVLTGTGKNIRDVAFMFGFRDEFYFSRIFRQITGRSPLKYRKSSVPPPANDFTGVFKNMAKIKER